MKYKLIDIQIAKRNSQKTIRYKMEQNGTTIYHDEIFCEKIEFPQLQITSSVIYCD